MDAKFLKVVMLAAVADGEIQVKSLRCSTKSKSRIPS